MRKVIVAKDRHISFLQLDGEVCGRSSKKRPWSTDKKSQNCLEIGEWVGGTWWSGIIFSKKEISYLVFNRSHAGKLGELCMNVDKLVCTNLVGKCEHGI